MTEYSILHISDLHKEQDLNYLNLFSSLKSDCESYTMEGISKPEIIVISGDLIEGAVGINASQEIEKQYKEVECFLNDLVLYFLNGDKSRIVIVPGNHDFNREVSINSMDLSESDPKEDYKLLKKGVDSIRWSWTNFAFYRINNHKMYKTRFTHFVDFYNRFFLNVRSISIECEENGYIIDIPSHGISFACFNSCHKLDHLNPAGCICPSAIALLHDELIDLNKKGRLIVGVWHHHISGLPTQNNYLDKRILNEMMTKHIRVGLFGHQHISDIVNEYKDLANENKIILISSGSLYGRNRHLPQGVSRQYNVINVKISSSDVKMTINVRRDCSEDLYDIPMWKSGAIGYSSMKEISFDFVLLKPQLDYVVFKIDEEAQASRDFQAACSKLKELGLTNPIVGKCFDSYIKHIDDYSFLIECIGEPCTSAQCLAVLASAIELRKKHILQTVLNYDYVNKCNTAYVIEYRKKAIELNNKL